MLLGGLDKPLEDQYILIQKQLEYLLIDLIYLIKQKKKKKDLIVLYREIQLKRNWQMN